MSDAVTATYVFDETQWKIAQRIYRTSWKYRAGMIFIAVYSLGFFGFGIFRLGCGENYRASAIICILIGFMLPTMRFFRLRNERRLFVKSSSYNIESIVTFDGDRFKATSKNGTADISLGGFISATLAPEGFLLFQHARYFIWIPASGFASPEDFAKACALVKANVKKVKDRRG